MNFEFICRHDAHRTDDYWFEIDEYKRGEDQFLLVHLQFFKWSPAVYKRLIHDWRSFRTVVTAPLFACPRVDDEKLRKFVTKTGWRFLQDITCDNGETRPLFIHTA